MPKDFLQSLWAHTFCNTFCSKTSLRRSLLLKRVPISRIMPNPITMNISGIHLTPHKTKLSTTFQPLLLFYHLKNKKLQVLFEQMLEFTGFSGTRFLNLPLAYHSFLRYIKFAIRSISSVSVLSRTWQYRSIVICKEL